MKSSKSIVAFCIVTIILCAITATSTYYIVINNQTAKNVGAPTTNNVGSNKAEIVDGRYVGYLSENDVYDGRKYLASMPSLSSQTKVLDDQIAENMVDKFYGTDRWLLAASDAELKTDTGTQCHFNCQLGVTVSKENTPKLYELISRISTDAHHFAKIVKDSAYRQRPYAQAIEKFGKQSVYAATCRPDEQTSLNENSSYPSGHTTFGYLAGLVLAQVDPADGTKLIERGRQYSESRLVCNYHWYSDIQSGREVASAAFNRLQNNEEYLSDIKEAQTEFNAIKAKNQKPHKVYTLVADEKATSQEKKELEDINNKLLNKDCDWENKILSIDLSSALTRN